MDASAISALAALVGATIGGLTSFLASWLTQRTQTRVQWIGQAMLRREDV
jgi:Mn2+/Fe2+ NRAMP family transporter